MVNIMKSNPGRPASQKFKKDLGTPELIAKRKIGITTEPLDLCFERRIIDDSQHRCAIYFRWLYTLRFGLPTVRAYDLARTKGRDVESYKSHLWLHEKQGEYERLVRKLKAIEAFHVILDICVYNMMPKFLRNGYVEESPELFKFQEGLFLLVREADNA